MSQESFHPCGQADGVFHLALPDYENTPTKGAQLFKVFSVTVPISAEFRKPVGPPGFWNVRVAATFVLVPETPPDVDDFA